MTVERRFVASLADIRAVTLECAKCGARVSVSPEKAGPHLVRACPSCDEAWSFGGHTKDSMHANHVARLLETIGTTRQSQAEATRGVRILLEFDEPVQ